MSLQKYSQLNISCVQWKYLIKLEEKVREHFLKTKLNTENVPVFTPLGGFKRSQSVKEKLMQNLKKKELQWL